MEEGGFESKDKGGAREYVLIEEARDSYLQDRREILKNNDWEAGVNCLELDMGIPWWEW